ncbi:DUF1127 domain-containing protein [Granulosicoccus sp. 3-233]|uniref:DUF1127 domain-containing protein n=1 Tax=Granulosicoccus sp. 3-233 TaxID=3417969 RepID=UPI003D3253AC
MSRAAGDRALHGCWQTECNPTSKPLAGAGRLVSSRGFFHVLEQWFERSRQRRELRELMASPEETFKDIGLSRYDVQREERKPFWRE